MNKKVSILISKVANGNKSVKRTMKKIYNSFNSIEKGKFNVNLKLFIKEKNESTIQKN